MNKTIVSFSTVFLFSAFIFAESGLESPRAMNLQGTKLQDTQDFRKGLKLLDVEPVFTPKGYDKMHAGRGMFGGYGSSNEVMPGTDLIRSLKKRNEKLKDEVNQQNKIIAKLKEVIAELRK